MTSDLQVLIDALLPEAREASSRAWSPYSGAQVGAVVRASGGQTFVGCNVESASYGLTQCAERNALAAAVAAGVKPGEMDTLLIFARGFESISPCGGCRQVISELMGEFAVIIACSEDQPPSAWTVSELFPAPFKLK